MVDDSKEPELEVVTEDLDEDEKEFRSLRRDLPGVKGASAVGIVNVNVSKTPGKNEFFRTHPDFRAVFPVIDLEVGNGEAVLCCYRRDGDIAGWHRHHCLRVHALPHSDIARCGTHCASAL